LICILKEIEGEKMLEPMDIQWYPGHMTKTVRLMEKKIGLCDGVVEIVDSRIPKSSRNPEFDRVLRQKPRIIVLNKSDLSDPEVNEMWKRHYLGMGIKPFSCDSKSGKGIKGFDAFLEDVFADILSKYRSKGMTGKKLRLMVVGVPNVGKSTFINKLAGSVVAAAADRPGVTRSGQWVVTKGLSELYDTPGVLWHKFEDKTQGEHLAYCGSVKDDILDKEYLACRLCEFLMENYKDCFCERYSIPKDTEGDGWDLLQLVAKKRGMLLSGGELNTERAATALLDEFRAGKVGKISFERP
jgi:ribosome biogenesis GTPase A